MASERREFDISKELWREYDFGDRIYRIDEPVTLVLFFRTGPYTPRGFGQQGDTHRVVDKDGVVHCVPRPGIDGCVIRWKNQDNSKPVNF